jgi:1-acyl-sn-glycerol-3-phosphate acyltransferase
MERLRRLAAILFFAVVVRPVLLIATGLRVLDRERLPKEGPAVVAANHNSHLDVVALMSLFPLRMLHRIRPVAAADHFSRPGPIGWMARKILGIIPIDRSGKGAENVLGPVREALERRDIVIIFPEGTRGEPEVLQKFRRGASVLAEAYPDVPFVPVYLHGLGKILPRGEWRFVPFSSEAHVGLSRRGAAEPGRPMSALLQADIEAMSKATSLARFAVE